MTNQTKPYRYIDADDFCLSARLLPDLDNGGVTETLSITIEGSDEPQSVHVPLDQLETLIAGLRLAAGAVSAAVAPPTNRAAVYREAADALDAGMERFFSEWPDEPRNSRYALGQRDAANELRRMADECPECGDTGACNGGPCPLRRMADETATQTPAAVLTESERKMLAYALDQAQEHIWSRDGFTDEDQAAVDSLRRLTTDGPAAGARQDGTET